MPIPLADVLYLSFLCFPSLRALSRATILPGHRSHTCPTFVLPVVAMHSACDPCRTQSHTSSSSPSPPSSGHFDPAEGNRYSKASISSYPSSASRLLSDPFPSIPRRLTSYGSSPSLSVASDSPYVGPSRPLSLGDQVCSLPFTAVPPVT